MLSFPEKLLVFVRSAGQKQSTYQQATFLMENLAPTLKKASQIQSVYTGSQKWKAKTVLKKNAGKIT